MSAVAAPPALANTGHWRSVGVAFMSTPGGSCSNAQLGDLARDDGVYLEWIACSEDAACPTPTDLHFHVPDFAEVSDATLSFDVHATGGDARAEITCVDAGGVELARLIPDTLFPAAPSSRVWDVPPACFAGEDVVLRVTRTGSDCLGADHVALQLRSSRRRAPITAVTAPAGSACDEGCITQLAADDGSYLEWLACAPGYAYDTPTDLHFSTFDHGSISGALLTLDAIASGPDARARVSCVDGAGSELATVVPERLFPMAGESETWVVPPACTAGPETRLRIERTGGHCVGLDHATLLLGSNAREARIVFVPTDGSCKANGVSPACEANLNRDDGDYLAGVACEGGSYTSPMELQFATPDFDSIGAASLLMEFAAPPGGTSVEVTCVDAAGSPLATILPASPHAAVARTYAWGVPAACFAGAQTRVRLASEGCLAVDFARLLTVSAAPAGMVVNRNALEGYSDRVGVRRGEDIAFKVHAPNGAFEIEFIRYGRDEVSMGAPLAVPGQVQNYPADASEQGAGWSTSHVLTVPLAWRSGLYAARLSDGLSEYFVTFVVGDPIPRAPLAVLASSNTWQAYNAWGGKSLYQYHPADESRRPFANRMSTQRPNGNAHPGTTDPTHWARMDHLAGAERYVLEWLEEGGHDYALLSDSDLHDDPDSLDGYHAVLVSTHSEYWTPEMRDRLDDFLAAGGSLLYLSGNGLYWKTTRQGDQLEVQKFAASHLHDGSPGGLWQQSARPEAAVTGVAYPLDDPSYCTAAPIEVFLPEHWVFAGTGVVAGSLVGAGGHPGNCGPGVSGWEMDRVTPHTPANAVLLAKGTNAGGGGADVVYYDHPGGGGVFSIGSINLGRSLVVDATLSAMLKNVLARFLPPACSDGLDNDGDGLADHPADPGCQNQYSNLESPACNDGIDNDLDGLIDLQDGVCGSQAWYPTESASACGLGFEVVLLLPLIALRRRRS